LRGREALAQLLEPRRDLLLVHRLQEAIERGLRHQQAQEQPEQAIEARRADLLGAAGDRRRAAHAGGDPRISRQRACSRSKRVRASAAARQHRRASDGGGCGAAAAGRAAAGPLRRACTLASIAARNRGTETRPAR
jgi:hypothetical protein